MLPAKPLKIFLLVGLLIAALAAILYYRFPKLSQKITNQITPSPSPKQLMLKDIAKLLQASPSAQNDQQIIEAVEKLAKTGSRITLNDCNPDPEILKLDSDNLTISTDKDIKISNLSFLKQTLRANQTKEIKVEPALYTYSCELVNSSSITPQVRGLIYRAQTVVPVKKVIPLSPQNRTSFSDLNKDAQQLLKATIRTAVSTDSAIIALADKVATQSASKIRLDPCDAKPFFIRNKKGAVIIFTKEDSLDHTLEFDKKKYKMASSSGEIKIDRLSSPTGVFTVKCDFNGRRGIVFIP